MKKSNVKTHLIAKKSLIFFLVLTAINAVAQLRVSNEHSIHDIVTKVLLDRSENFNVRNISYKGSPLAIGVFDCEFQYNTLIKRGVILSTGNVSDATGPNNSPNKSYKTSVNIDPELEALSNGKTYDAATLEFDITATGDSISFNFFFASEEYPEYVGRGVNDVFGFFVTDLATNEKKNLAVIPGTNISITVDNVNDRKNSSYFIKNYQWNETNPKLWEEHKQAAELSYFFEFDGLTKLIRASMPTKQGNAYHVKMSVADVGDRIFDSAIFIEANSFKTAVVSPLTTVKKQFGISDKNTDFVSVNLYIHYDSDSSNIKEADDIKLLNKVYLIMKNNPALNLQINGHTDESGTTKHNLQLSEERAKTVAVFLLNKGLGSERISYQGLGHSQPLNKTDKNLNRRVEFVFR